MQEKPFLPKFGDLLNKVGQIKLTQKFQRKPVHANVEMKKQKIVNEKKKAINLLVDKLIYKLPNVKLTQKFGVNDDYISNRLRELKRVN